MIKNQISKVKKYKNSPQKKKKHCWAHTFVESAVDGLGLGFKYMA